LDRHSQRFHTIVAQPVRTGETERPKRANENAAPLVAAVRVSALSEFQVHEEIRRARFAELKAKIQVGIEQLDRGETAEFDLNEFLAARNAEHASR
jgi:anti-sigma28 factor (negative regulator of flagellin synthesis)